MVNRLPPCLWSRRPVASTDMSDTIADAVDGGDPDRAVRLIDGLCASRDWDGLVAARDRCRFVIERGLQMSGPAEYAEYRLALDAPASYAGAVVAEEAGRFALGPLWEVAASSHTWEELSPHLDDGPPRTLAAYERVLRGEQIVDVDDVDEELLDLPFEIADWEPQYEVAEYLASEARFPAPAVPAWTEAEVTPVGEGVVDEAAEALMAVAALWADLSNGSVAAVRVDGSAESSIAALGHDRVLVAEIDTAAAMARLAWAGASGGAYGRRRGAAMGRFAAWWAAGVITDVEWPSDPDELGRKLEGARWLAWEPAGAAPGWSASIAVELGDAAWALLALDSHREEVASSE